MTDLIIVIKTLRFAMESHVIACNVIEPHLEIVKIIKKV
jgi:hypothetical protein